MRILLFKGQSFISKLIKWQTRSEYSHSAMLFNGDILIESREKIGVRLLENPTYDCVVDVFTVPCIDNSVEHLVFNFALRQLGKRYDYSSVVRFITRQQETRRGRGSWFCSELVFASLQKGGVRLLERIEPWAVSPELLSISPLLIYEKTITPS